MEENEVATRMASDLLNTLRLFVRAVKLNRAAEAVGPQLSATTTEATDDFYDSRSEGERDDEGEGEEEDEEEYDNTEYAIPVANMSLELRKALGLSNVMDSDENVLKMAAQMNWRAPERSGLDNSAGTSAYRIAQ